ncbi:MAG: aminopeptidase [Bacilli bacterium]|nr:aminopeptidase [Bacilli bacterium]
MKNLLKEKTNPWEKINIDEKQKIYDFSQGFIDFINNNKTERECVKTIEKILKKNNFKNIETIAKLKPNDKVYYINRRKNIYAAIIGKKINFNMITSHLDSPRIDLKPNPIYESEELAFFKTHYYGGIKKYQWVNIPLSMHGIIITKDKKIEINIGEKETDPVFTIPDLLPHLSKNQENKTLKDAIEGENLNILIGSIPINEEVDTKTKLNILNILNEKYNIKEEDFESAEIEFTPNFKAKDLGFDRSLIAGYGQDDKVCAYTSLKALLEIENPEKTVICTLTDKEEIGSMGNTGMSSNTFDYFIDLLLEKANIDNKEKNKIYNTSKALSADVTGAYNPNYPDIYEKNNESFLNKGVSIMKYTGTASKGGASDANAEYLAYIKNLFISNNITYQVSEMGKIGIGGGGTISYILANKGMDVLDCGIPILSMHSPYEISSKFDIYTSYKAYKVFYKN